MEYKVSINDNLVKDTKDLILESLNSKQPELTEKELDAGKVKKVYTIADINDVVIGKFLSQATESKVIIRKKVKAIRAFKESL